jgi:hypothetical protein
MIFEAISSQRSAVSFFLTAGSRCPSLGLKADC